MVCRVAYYFGVFVDRPDEMIRRALEAGAGLISPILSAKLERISRLLVDSDGHILAIAKKLDHE